MSVDVFQGMRASATSTNRITSRRRAWLRLVELEIGVATRIERRIEMTYVSADLCVNGNFEGGSEGGWFSKK